MRRFKPGAARMADGAGVPILPVTIHGGNLVWPPGKKFPGLGAWKSSTIHCFTSKQTKRDDQRGYARRATEALQATIAKADTSGD
jgi:1-acyl-sn-glycerol-3-phosphate acyltransferase